MCSTATLGSASLRQMRTTNEPYGPFPRTARIVAGRG
jgi:hypothetical protein